MNRITITTSFDTGVLHVDALAKYAAASFKKSRSFFTRTNDTRASTTDPEGRLYKRTSGSESSLCYLGHNVMENRHGLIVNAEVSEAHGMAERDTALELLSELPGKHRKTVGADKLFDTRDFIQRCRQQHITPHVACNDQRRGGSTLDARTTRHVGYEISQRIRKRIEETFGWMIKYRPDAANQSART